MEAIIAQVKPFGMFGQLLSEQAGDFIGERLMLC